MLRFTEFQKLLVEVDKETSTAPFKAYLQHVADELGKDKPFGGEDKHLVSNAGIIAGLKLAAEAAKKKADGPEAQVLAKAMVSLKTGDELHSDEASKAARDALHKIAKQTPMIQTVYAAMSADDKAGAIKLIKGVEKDVAGAQITLKAKVGKAATPVGKAAPAAGKEEPGAQAQAQ